MSIPISHLKKETRAPVPNLKLGDPSAFGFIIFRLQALIAPRHPLDRPISFYWLGLTVSCTIAVVSALTFSPSWIVGVLSGLIGAFAFLLVRLIYVCWVQRIAAREDFQSSR